MSDNKIAVSQDYISWVGELSKRYRHSQVKAAVKVNEELILFYLGLGRDIVERNMDNTYGSGFYASLSRDLQQQLPNATGLSTNNLRYAKHCYAIYNKAIRNLPQLVEDFNSENLPQLVGNFKDGKLPQGEGLLA